MKQTLSISFFLIINLIFAQNQDTIKIDEIVISDSVVSTYNKIIIEPTQNVSKSTGELMQKIPGVSITKRSAFSVEPTINSFKYEQVNTMINNGMSVSSSCPNRMDPITTRIAPDDINEIEIVRGPYSMRYGQIFAGYINLITYKNPHYTKASFGGSLASEYNFNGNGSTVLINLKGGSTVFDVNLNINSRNFDNYTAGNGEEISSSYQTYGLNSSIGLNISEKQRLQLGIVYSKANDVMHAGLPMDAKYDESFMYSLDYSFSNISDLVSNFVAKIYFADEDHLMTNEYRPNASVSLANTPVQSQNYGGRFELTLNPFKNTKIYAGADFKQIAKDGMKEVTIFKNGCTTPPTSLPTPIEKEFEVWQNSYSQDLGAFIDLQYLVNEQLKIKTGLRSDFVKSDIKDAEQDFLTLYNDDITPDDILNLNYYAQATYILPKNYSIEISAGHGTRNPSLLERYINHFTIGLDAYEYVGNPHLKSESNNQINLMMSKKNKFAFIYLNTFYSQIINYITAVEDTNIARKFLPCKEPKYAKRFVNIDNSQQYGFNIGGNVNFLKYLWLSVDLTYTYAQNLDLDEPLPEIAPFTSLISLKYKYKDFTVLVQNEYQLKQDRISELVGEKESDAFSIVNINIFYTLFKDFSFGFSIDNISDKNYYRHLSRPYKNMDTYSMFYEPGRSFRIFAKYSF